MAQETSRLVHFSGSAGAAMPCSELDHVASTWMCHALTWPAGRSGRRADGWNAGIDVVEEKVQGIKSREET